MNRQEILKNLRNEVAAGRAILATGAGIGLSAKCAEMGGADLIMIYSSGHFRMAGRPSPAGILPFANANDVVLGMVSTVATAVRSTPVLAGVCAIDPLRNIRQLLLQLKDLGIVGVQNSPTVGGLDGVLRREVEETGMGFDREVEMIRVANELDLLTVPYVYDVQQTQLMVEAGADMVVPHMGLTTSGSVGAKTAKSLDECVEAIQEIREAAIAIRPDILVLCHGGPIVTPDDATYIIGHTKGVVGYFGASSIERIPVERAIRDITGQFKAIALST